MIVMRKFEIIRRLFDLVIKHGEKFNISDPISAFCTRDGLVNRINVRSLSLVEEVSEGMTVDCVYVESEKNDMSDATDSGLRIRFNVEAPQCVTVWANELNDDMLARILAKTEEVLGIEREEN